MKYSTCFIPLFILKFVSVELTRENFKKLIELSPEGVYICSPDAKIVYVNDSFCNIIGYRRLEILNKPGYVFMHPDYQKSFIELLENHTDTTTFENQFISKAGETIWVESVSTPVEWDKGGSRVAFVRNINSRKKEREDLLELNKRLREYAFITSHKLRHPLANILGLSRLINSEDYADPENKIILENLIVSAIHLNDVVHELNATLTSHQLLDETHYFRKSTSNKKIMLIDDDIINNYINKTMIDKFDAEIEIMDFVSGDKALAYLKDGRNLPDVILLDLNMPILDGWQFLNKFRDLKIKNIEIFILTTSVDQRDRDQASSYDFIVQFISKPLTFEWLNQILNKNQLHLFKGES